MDIKQSLSDLFWIILRNTLNSKQFLSIRYRTIFKKDIDWRNPKTLSEKIQWMKVYGYRPEYTMMADKILVKDYVKAVIGDEYVIPTIGIWDSEKEIDFNKLPEKFVLKANHNSSGTIICTDKSKLDIEGVKKNLHRQLKQNYYIIGHETAYRDINRRILAEPYMHDEKTGELRDYKFFCFDGIVKSVLVTSNRTDVLNLDYFDADFNHLPFKQGYENSKKQLDRPVNFELMKNLASKLSAGIPFVRVDLYEINGKVYFGEMTFYHYNGFAPFDPPAWDEIYGSWMTLPERNES